MTAARAISRRIGRVLITTGLGVTLVCGLLALASVTRSARAAPLPPRAPSAPPALQATVGVTSTIQQAINSAAVGDTVVFTGTYTESVIINKPLTLMGAFPTSTIVYRGFGTGPTIRVVSNAVTITNMTLDASAIALMFDSAIFVQNSGDVLITGVTIKDYETGIEVERTVSGPTGITVTNNTILHSAGGVLGDGGIYFSGSGAGAGVIQASIQSNRVAGYSVPPLINADGLAPTLITSNVLTSPGPSPAGAIYLNQAGLSLVRGNILAVSPLTATGVAGIKIDGTATPTVTQNIIPGQFSFGIEALDFAAPVITNSVLFDHSIGIYVHEDATSYVFNNVITGTGIGIRVAADPLSLVTPTIRNNQVVSNGVGISLVRANTGLERNLIRDSGGDGILVGSGSSLLTAFGNTICRSGGYGLNNTTGVTQTATGNWWGHNPPLISNTTPSDYQAPVAAMPPISMSLSVDPALIPLDASAAVTLTMRGDGRNVLDGTGISFSATAGSLDPTATTTLNGIATTIYTGTTLGPQVITATDDCGGLVTTTVIVGQPVLTATKRAQPPSGSVVSPGDLITYTIYVTNTGGYTAIGVVFSDTVPTFTQLAFASIDTGTITPTNPISATFLPIAPGNVMSVTFGVTVTLPLTNGTIITNSATISYFNGAADVVTATNPVTHRVASSPDITVTKTAVPPHGSDVSPGDLITYTLVITNQGDANATGVVVSDTVPANTDVVSYSPVPNGTSPALRWDIPFLAAPTGTTTITFTVRVTQPLASGTIITNAAQVTVTEVPTITYSNLVTHRVRSSVILTIAKTAEPPSGSVVTPTDTITYHLTITNTGDADATGVVITDVIPAHTHFISGSESTDVGVVAATTPVLMVTAPVLTGTQLDGTQSAIHVSFAVTVTTPLTNGTIISNTGFVSHAETTVITPSNTVTHIVVSSPDITITKTADPPHGSTVQPGEPITYTLRITNNGSANATGVVVSDTIPLHTIYATSAASPGGTPSYGAGVLTVNAPLLSGGGGVLTATLRVTVTLPLTNGTLITNTAWVTSTEVPTITYSNQVTHVVVSSPQLTITKTAQPPHGSVVSPGDLITYTLRVSNTGDANATGVVVSDTIPTYTTLIYTDATPGVSVTWGNPLVADVPFLPAPTGTAVITLAVQVTSPLTDGTIITNMAQVTATEFLMVTTSNVVTHVVRSLPQLTITKAAVPPHGSVVNPGDLITYTVTINNIGDANATGVVVSDTVPANTDVVSYNPVPNGTSPALRWDIPFLAAPTGTTIITFTVRVTSPLASGTIITNTAQVTATEFLTVTTSNVVTHRVQSIVDITFTKSADPPSGSTVAPGAPITYTLTATNTGTQIATGVVMTDVLPADTNFVSVWCQPAVPACTVSPPPPPRVFNWNLGTLNAGQTVTATIQVTVTTPLTRGTVITNVALLRTDLTGISTTNTVTHTVISTPTLTLSKSADPPGGSMVLPGDVITYTLAATNSGNGPATNFLITDTVPATTTFVGWLGVTPGFSTGGPSPLTVSGTLGAGQAMTATFAVTVSTAANDGDVISNIGYVSYAESPVISPTNYVTHLVQSAPPLTLTKAAEPSSGSVVSPGDLITYTVTVTNTGSGPANSVVITDALPAHTNFVTGSFTATLGAISGPDPLVVNVPTLSGGATMSFTFQVTVTTPLTSGTVISNIAQMTATGVPSVTSSNEVTHTVVATPLLSVVKSNVPNNLVVPGSPLVYTLRVRNDGGGSATNVVITDILPSVVNFWFDVVPVPTATRTIAGPTWVLTIPSLPGGGTEVSVPIVVMVTTPLTNGLVFTNVASYVSDQTPLTDSNVVTNVIDSEPVLVATKLADPPDGSFVDPGDTITYTITIENTGTENAPNVVITDTLPAYTNYVAGSVGIAGGVNSTASYTVPNTILGRADWLNVGDMITLSYVVTVTTPLTDGTIISNIALVDSDRTAVDNTNLVTHVVQSRAELTYTKTAQPPPGPITPGDTITYSITLTNTGSAAATGLVLTDVVPSYTNFIPGSESASGTAVESGGVLTFTGSVPGSGGAFTATFAVTVTTPLADGTQIVNVASFTTTQTGVISQTNAVTHTVVSTPALVISKVADPPSGSTVEPGDWITYTLTAVNSGAADATGVVMTDTLDPNVNFVDVTPSVGVGGPNPLVFNVGTLPGNGGVVSYTVRVTVTTPLTNGTIISNAAWIAATEVPTPVLSNEVTHTVVATPNLIIQKWSAPPNGSTVDPGDPILYFIGISNNGTAPATNLTITDTLPISTTFTGAWFLPLTTTGSIAGPDPLVATIPSLPAGGWVTFNFAVTVTNSAPPGLVITNVAQVNSNETALTNTNVVTHIVSGAPVLVIAKTADPPAGTTGLSPGSSITYTVTVTNIGSGPANNVVISDTLDPNVTLVSSATVPAVPIYGPNPVTATWASLAAGNSASLVMRVVITSPLAAGTIITNVASVDSDETLPVATGPVTHTVGGLPILSLSKTADPADGTPVSPGDSITYTLTVTNSGSDAANGLVLTDTLPAGVSYVPGSASVTPGFSVVSTPPPALVVTGTLPAGNVLTATFRVTVSPVASGTLLVNTAEVTATDTGLLTDTTTHPVAVPVPNLAIAKTAVPPSGSIVQPGDWITYTVTVVNSGSPASSVVVTDTLDLVNVTLVTSNTTRGTLSGPNPVQVTGFNLGTGEAMTVTLGVTVTGNVSGTVINNQASVTSTESVMLGVSNLVTHVISSTLPSPNLVITKTAIPAAGTVGLLPGSSITYTITVANVGTGPANNVVISDTLDPNVTLVSSVTVPAVPIYGPNPVTATWGSLAAGNSASLVLGVVITNPLADGTVITNVASVDSDETLLVATGPVTHRVGSFPILSLSKTADPVDGTPVSPGDTITYTLTVANSGFDAANGLVLTDTLPAGVSYVPGSVSVTPGFSIVSTPPPALVVTGTLPAGDVLTATFRVTVSPVASGTLLINTAEVTATDTSLLTDTTTHPVVVPAPSLAIAKTAVPPSGSIVQPGDWITYTVTVVNSGGAASNVVVTDTLDLANVTLVTSNTTRGTLSGPNPVQVTGFNLGTGEAMTVTLGVTVTGNVSGTIINNQASVASAETPLPQASNVVTHVISSTVLAPSLAVAKSAVPPSGSVVEPGDFITYTVTVQNSGSGPATGVVVSDTLDTDVLLVSALASTGTVTTGPPLRVDGFNLAAGDTMTVTIVVTVTNVPSGTLITNQASVTSTESVVLGVSNVVTHVISNTSVVAPNFTLTKSADPPGGTLVTQGDTITYTIVAVNSGGPATNVVITDVIPVGTSYVLGSATTNLGTANFDGTQVTISATNFLAGSTLTATFRVTVMTSLTTTITNIAVLASDQTAPQNSNPVSHPVQGVGTSRIYLPSIYKNFIAPFASLAWVGQTEDRVRLVDGSDPLAFTPDGQNDGAFQLTVSVGSTGPKTVSSVQLTSSQGAGVEWDTLINGLPVLGIFDGGARLNNADGTIDRLVNGQVTVTLYASDDGGGRFPTDTYDYTVIVTFTDGTTLVAQARIPASPPSPPPPPPPPLPTPPPPPSPTPVSLRPTSPSDYVS